MYFFLILFFISLFGIILMIGRKLLLLPNNTSNKKIESILTSEFFSLENIKDVTIKNLKKYGFVILVITLRISIKSSHLIKKGYKGTKNKMIKMVNVYLFGKRN